MNKICCAVAGHRKLKKWGNEETKIWKWNLKNKQEANKKDLLIFDQKMSTVSGQIYLSHCCSTTVFFMAPFQSKIYVHCTFSAEPQLPRWTVPSYCCWFPKLWPCIEGWAPQQLLKKKSTESKWNGGKHFKDAVLGRGSKPFQGQMQRFLWTVLLLLYISIIMEASSFQ